MIRIKKPDPDERLWRKDSLDVSNITEIYIRYLQFSMVANYFFDVDTQTKWCNASVKNINHGACYCDP